MDLIKKYIQEEVQKLKEEQYLIPSEIKNSLEGQLALNPLERYVSKLRPLNSIPPAYTIFLNSGKTFDLYYEEFSLMAKIEGREYYLMDMEERSNAIEHINRLLVFNVRPIPSHTPGEEGEEEDFEDMPPEDEGGSPPPPPPPPPEEEPEEEPPAEEPEEEPV